MNIPKHHLNRSVKLLEYIIIDEVIIQQVAS